jgi:Zn-dependent peptidase ImmA (M78 family)
MLTQKQLINLFESGVDIHFKTDRRTKKTGLYTPDLDIDIYLNNISSDREKCISVLHELIHARDNFKCARLYEERPDDEVEQEATKTYYKRSEVLTLARLIYAF